LIGSGVDTVVITPVAGPTRSPICASAIPATPSIGDLICVNSRLRRACASAALAEASADDALS
jgi:hypothetical protein